MYSRRLEGGIVISVFNLFKRNDDNKQEMEIANYNQILPNDLPKLYPISSKELLDLIIQSGIEIRKQMKDDNLNAFKLSTYANSYDFLYASLITILSSDADVQVVKDNKYNIGKKFPYVYAYLESEQPSEFEVDQIEQELEWELKNKEENFCFKEIIPGTNVLVFAASDENTGECATLHILYFDGKELRMYTPLYANPINQMFACGCGGEKSIVITDNLFKSMSMYLEPGEALDKKMLGRKATRKEFKLIKDFVLNRYYKKNGLSDRYVLDPAQCFAAFQKYYR